MQTTPATKIHLKPCAACWFIGPPPLQCSSFFSVVTSTPTPPGVSAGVVVTRRAPLPVADTLLCRAIGQK